MPANTHVHDCSLSWRGTPNTHVHDCSLSWLIVEILMKVALNRITLTLLTETVLFCYRESLFKCVIHSTYLQKLCKHSRRTTPLPGLILSKHIGQSKLSLLC
jgi:hypothetical protein